MDLPSVEIALNQSDRFSLKWWRQRIFAIAPGPIRKKYSISQGAYWHLLRAYAVELSRKTRMFFRPRKRNVLLEEYLQRCEQLEKSDE